MYTRFHVRSVRSYRQGKFHASPQAGQEKQEVIYKHQMLSATDVALGVGATFNPKIKVIKNISDFAKATKEMFKSWFQIVHDWVVETYQKVKDAMQRWSLTIVHAVETLAEAVRTSAIKVADFFSTMAAMGVNLCAEWFNKIKQWFADKAKQVKSAFTKQNQAQGFEGEDDYLRAMADYAARPSEGTYNIARQCYHFMTNADIQATFVHSPPDEMIMGIDPGVTHQGFVEDCIGPLLMTLVMGVLSCCEHMQVIPKSASEKFYKTVNCLSAAGKMDFSKIGSFFNIVYHAITGKDLTVSGQLNREFAESTTLLMKYVAELDITMNPPTELQEKISVQFRRMENAYPALLSYDDRSNPNRTALYNHLYKKASPWMVGAKSGSVKIKPVVIVLAGLSATGKTTAQTSLIRDVPANLSALFSDADRKDTAAYASHSRMSSSYSIPCLGKKPEFDDGYRDQLFYCFEEYLSSKLQDIKGQWANHFMKCIDGQPYPLNMAFDKGGRYFNSPFVVATGNFTQHYVPLEDRVAYFRRIEFDLVVTRDESKMGGFMETTVFTPSASMMAIYKSTKAPSAFLQKVFRENNFQPFGYPVLLELVIGAYVDRLLNHHIMSQANPLMAIQSVLDNLKPLVAQIPDGLGAYVMASMKDIYTKAATEPPVFSQASFEKFGEDFQTTAETLVKAVEKSSKKINRKLKAAIKSPKQIQEETDELFKPFVSFFNDLGDKMKSKEKSKKKKSVFATSSSDSDTEELTMTDKPAVVHQSGGAQVYTPPPIPSGPSAARCTFARAEAIFESFPLLLELVPQKAFSNRIMVCQPHDIPVLLQWRSLDTICDELQWVPSVMTQHYTANPWVHLHQFNIAVLAMKGYAQKLPDGKLPPVRSDLTSGQWSNVKTLFYKAYFHWYMACDTASALCLDGEKFTAQGLSSLWRQAITCFTNKEIADFRYSVRVSFECDIALDGKLLPINKKWENKYKERVLSNEKRNARRNWDKKEQQNLMLEQEAEDSEVPESQDQPHLPDQPRGYVKKQVEDRKDRAKVRDRKQKVREGRTAKYEHQMFTGRLSDSITGFHGDQDIGGMCPYSAYTWFSIAVRTRDWTKMEVPVPRFYTTVSYRDQFMKTFRVTNDPFMDLTAIFYYHFMLKFPNDRTPQALDRLLLRAHGAAGCLIGTEYLVPPSKGLLSPKGERTISDMLEALINVPADQQVSVARRLMKQYRDDLSDDRVLVNYLEKLVDYQVHCTLMNQVIADMLSHANADLHPLVAFHQCLAHLTHNEPNPLIVEVDMPALNQLLVGKKAAMYVSTEELRSLRCVVNTYFSDCFGEAIFNRLFTFDTPESITTSVMFGVVVIIAVPFLVYVINKVIAYFKPKVDADMSDAQDVVTAGAAYKYLQQSVKTTSRKPPPPTKVPAPQGLNLAGLIHQMGSGDPGMLKVCSNSYKIITDCAIRASGTFLSGTIMQMNAHVWEALPETFELRPYITLPEIQHYMIHKSQCTLLELNKSKDLCIVSISGVRSHHSITKHVATQEEIDKFPVVPSGLILSFNQHGDIDLQVVDRIVSMKERLEVAPQYHLPNYLLYKWPGAKSGACGGLLFVTIDGRPKVVGFHTAGKTGEIGIASTISKEVVFQFDHKNKTESRHPSLKSLKPYELIALETTGTGYELQFAEDGTGQFVSPISTSATGQTQFVATEFVTHKFLGGPFKVPVALDYDSYLKALQKETRHDVVNVPWQVRKLVSDYAPVMVDKFYSNQPLYPCKTLEVEHALEGYKDLNNFDKDSSKGIHLTLWKLSKPQILSGDTADRRFFIGKYKESLERMKEGIYEYQLNTDKLKDEPRDLERVALKKVRIFKITSFFDNVHMKCAVGDLVNQTHDYHWITPPSCGVDPTGGEWRVIANHFDGEPVMDADISGFDTTVTAVMLPYFYTLFSRVYSGFDLEYAIYTIMATFYALRFNRGRGRFLGWQNTSGNWLTTWINTHVNNVYFCTVCIASCIQRGLDPLQVLALLKIKLYSDDNLTALRQPWWNPKEVGHLFKVLFNVDLTGADKSDISDDTRNSTIWDCSFLSRRFVRRNGQVFAPLAFDSLISQLFFVRVPKRMRGNSSFIYQQLQQNLDNVVRELAEYPEAEAQETLASIRDFILQHHLPLSLEPLPTSFAIAKLVRQ